MKCPQLIVRRHRNRAPHEVTGHELPALPLVGSVTRCRMDASHGMGSAHIGGLFRVRPAIPTPNLGSLGLSQLPTQTVRH